MANDENLKNGKQIPEQARIAKKAVLSQENQAGIKILAEYL